MIDCSKTENYFAEKQRMTKKQRMSDGTYICEIVCGDCPLSRSNNGMNIPCTNLEKSYPDKAIAIIQNWSDEHPQKTYLSKFLKNYPDAPLNDDGIPKGICPYDLGLNLGLISIEGCREDRNCIKCWNQLIEESESK
jgi:hypothetical protein